ncbi:MAG TPA: ATP-grasp fold amidoligase family protein [Oligoflexia bacterium]|nr:ATP-grasp fold amidoligase family protein [Oligoflexia bacterium]HMR23808.1 ATP-grasp fold amidoligase family protein [Oligoflexia bacterium]
MVENALKFKLENLTYLNELRDPIFFTEFLHARRTRSEDNVHFVELDKINFDDIAKKSGVKYPEVYKIYNDATEIVLSDLPEHVVIKPINLASAHGVYLLSKQGNKWFDTFTQKKYTEKQIIDSLMQWTKHKPKEDRRIIAQQYIWNDGHGNISIPCDYKLYTFGDKIPFISKVDRNNGSVLSFYGEDFSDFDFKRNFATHLPKFTKKHVVTEKPKRYKELLELARKVSNYMKDPFMRIDCYSDGEEVYLGEVTPCPGGPYYGSQFAFSYDFDKQLGDLWNEELQRLNLPKPKVLGYPPVILDIRDVIKVQKENERLRKIYNNVGFIIDNPLLRAVPFLKKKLYFLKPFYKRIFR